VGESVDYCIQYGDKRWVNLLITLSSMEIFSIISCRISEIQLMNFS